MSDATWSEMSVDGQRLTWQEAYEHILARAQRAEEFAAVLADLDRCQHGRHEGDACTLRGGCGGPSLGNPYAHPGQVIGFSLSGQPIVMPGRSQRHVDPGSWYARWDEEGKVTRDG
jgi:hypothetical protein